MKYICPKNLYKFSTIKKHILRLSENIPIFKWSWVFLEIEVRNKPIIFSGLLLVSVSKSKVFALTTVNTKEIFLRKKKKRERERFLLQKDF